MLVEKHTPDLLRLTRSPGIRSWSLFVGMDGGRADDIVQFAHKELHILITLAVLLFFIQGLRQSAWQQHITVRVNIAIRNNKQFVFLLKF